MSAAKSFTDADLIKIVKTLNDKNKSWVGYDFDGTMSMYNPEDFSYTEFGKPILPIINMIIKDLRKGKHVRIFTARMHPLDKCIFPNEYAGKAHLKSGELLKPTTMALASLDLINAIDGIVAMREWCVVNIGLVLPITNIKDPRMVKLYDDRAIQVVHNEGTLVQ